MEEKKKEVILDMEALRESPYSLELEKMKQFAVKNNNKTLFFIVQHILNYGAIRKDVFEYFKTNEISDVNSQLTLNIIGDCLKTDMPASWYQLINSILINQKENSYYFLIEVIDAFQTNIPLEIFREYIEDSKSPFEINLKKKEYLSGKSAETIKNEDRVEDFFRYFNTEVMEKFEKDFKNQQELVQQNELLKQKILQLEEQNQKEEDISMKIISFIRSYFEEKLVLKDKIASLESDLEKENMAYVEDSITGMPDENVPEFEDEFDESFVPEIENIEINEEDFLVGDDVIHEDNESEPEYPKQGSQEEKMNVNQITSSNWGNGQKENIVIENNFLEQKENHGKRILKFVQSIQILKRKKFLKLDDEKKKEELIKLVLSKKYSAEKINLVKKLFDAVSLEYIYDLILRNASEDEMENVLLLQD